MNLPSQSTPLTYQVQILIKMVKELEKENERLRKEIDEFRKFRELEKIKQ